MARVNISILGISKLKCTGMSEFNSDDHYIYYCGQESIWRNRVAIMVNKRVWNAILGCSLKNDRMTSDCFQGKPFNIMVIQVYALTSNAVSWCWTVLWRPTRTFRTNTQKRCPFHYRGQECKSRKCLVAQKIKCLPTMQETWVQSLGQENPLEKEMATHSSTVAWKIPWTEEPGRVQSMGSQRVGHDWVSSLHFKKHLG